MLRQQIGGLVPPRRLLAVAAGRREKSHARRVFDAEVSQEGERALCNWVLEERRLPSKLREDVRPQGTRAVGDEPSSRGVIDIQRRSQDRPSKRRTAGRSAAGHPPSTVRPDRRCRDTSVVPVRIPRSVRQREGDALPSSSSTLRADIRSCLRDAPAQNQSGRSVANEAVDASTSGTRSSHSGHIQLRHHTGEARSPPGGIERRHLIGFRPTSGCLNA